MALRSDQTVTRAAARPAGLRRGWSRYSNLTFFLFIAPWLFGFFALTAFPLAYALGISFTNFSGIAPRWHWIGLDNYSELLGDSDAWYSMGRTLLYTAITLPLGTAGGLALALLLNAKLRGLGLFRTIFYVPAVVPPVAAVSMFAAMFSQSNGLINAAIEWAGGPAVGWLQDPLVFTILIVMVMWGLGGGMVIFLAGLQGVPAELREAAAIDGANKIQEFFAVTLPLITPVLFYMLITGFIGSLQTLTQPLLLATTGQIGMLNVPRSNLLYMVNVYFQLFYNQRLAYASALLWVLFAVVLGITVLVFRFGTGFIYYEVEQDRRG